MLKENPNKKSIDLSSFLLELYKLKDELEKIIVEMEKIINV